MQYRILGKTNMKVSMISLGSGGHSRIGQGTGKSSEQSVSIVKEALNRGVNLIDSSEAYKTEEMVGQGIAGTSRSSIHLSTKASCRIEGVLKTPRQLEASLEASLQRLGTDYVDLYFMHGISIKDYDFVRSEMVPVMEKMKKQGKIRAIAISEAFSPDPGHSMLQRAVSDDCWDVFMVGFNILNQSARDRVLKMAIEKNIGILDMFAVRRGLSGKENLALFLKDLVGKGAVDEDWIDYADPLGFLLRKGGYESLTELAYRFCASEPGIHSILSGTGNPVHLDSNIRDILKGPLPEDDRKVLMSLFERVDSESGNTLPG